jgi:hypothetical protein
MIRMTIALTTAFALAAPLAAAKIGAPAPDFAVTDSNGKAVKLSAYRGKTVVLEWNNPGCPFVQKHYDSGNMQRTQAAAAKAGAVWLTVNSGAPGKQGHMDGPAANAFVKKAAASPSAYLLDPRGIVGKAFGARTTPEMVLIDARGTLVYRGAIDDRPTADPADIKGARNHLLAALGELKAGKPISVASSKPYGCSVKYGS